MADKKHPDSTTDFADNIEQITQMTQNVFKQVMEKQSSNANSSMPFDPMNLYSTYMDAWFNIWKEPSKAIEAQSKYIQDALKLWQNTSQKLYGGTDTVDPVIEVEKGDKRFRDEEWDSNVIFNYIKQSYLLASRCMMETVDGVDDLDQKNKKKLQFFTKQIVDTLSPTNFPHTNPSVVREAIESKGENLMKGMQNFIRDMEEGDGQLKIAMTDTKAFTLGENVATTPGKVVYQNDMYQLVQYSPSTTKVFKRPLLVIPPWINKFYIMDLQPKNSMIKWMVDQGQTVFVISWVNPDERHAKKTFEHYMTEGVLDALDQVEKASGSNEVNAIGYCIGGTLLTATLAYMNAKKDQRIKSATFFTALIDFSQPGDLGVFIDEQQVDSLEEKMSKDGYLEGKSMSNAFNMLRSNDLIWSFYINNYLLGKDPMVFDLLYWNSDNTRLPAAMHSFYLRNMYVENKFKEPGGVELAGVPIDVSKIKIPCYFISAIDDHIAPWESTYAGAKLLSGPVNFVLGGSGHIAGIINPPAANKYGFWTKKSTSRRKKLPQDSKTWFEESEQHEGSWWPNWQQWVSSHDKRKVNARQPGKGKLKAIEDAPGSYVAKRL